MIITRQEYDSLTKEQLMSLKYSNPSLTNDPNEIRVGEVFDDWLGYWREADKSDF